MDGGARLAREDGRVVIKDSAMLRYAHRDQYYEDWHLYKYVSEVDRGEKSCEIAIPRPVPQREYNPNDPEQHELFCRDVLTLFKPWRGTPVSLIPLGSNWEHEFARFIASGDAPGSLLREVARFDARQRYIADRKDDETDGNDEEDSHRDLAASQGSVLSSMASQPFGDIEDWAAVVAPNFDNHSIASVISQFPLYYGDAEYSWDDYAIAHPDYAIELPAFASRLSTTAATLAGATQRESPTILQDQQRLAFAIVLEHYRRSQLALVPDPTYLIVNGTARTGKSKIIHLLLQHLPGACRVVAPSGVAAFNVHGVTIHALLKLPINLQRNAILEPFCWSAAVCLDGCTTQVDCARPVAARRR